LGCGPDSRSEAKYDILITGGLVVDGTGAPGIRADVGIKGEKIVAVGRLSAEDAARIIDATGLVVAPGIIDIHSRHVSLYRRTE